MLAASAPSFEADRVSIAAPLQSPHFLYRSELASRSPTVASAWGPYEVAACALSFCTGARCLTMRCFSAAERASSLTRVIERQARRMLLTRVPGPAGDFALQRLGVERVANPDKRGDLFPAWNGDLRQSLLDRDAEPIFTRRLRCQWRAGRAVSLPTTAS